MRVVSALLDEFVSLPVGSGVLYETCKNLVDREIFYKYQKLKLIH